MHRIPAAAWILGAVTSATLVATTLGAAGAPAAPPIATTAAAAPFGCVAIAQLNLGVCLSDPLPSVL